MADRFDASGRVGVAEMDGVAAGTIRLNMARDTDVSADFRNTYRISELETHIGQKWAYSSRLVISADSRGGAVLQQLADAHFELALREEVECLVLNCTPALVHLYEKLGCRRYAAGFLDEEVGYRVPMLAPIRNAEFQRIGRTLIWGLL